MNILKVVQKWNAYNQTVRELRALDDRALNDLGIAATDIDRLAREHADQV